MAKRNDISASSLLADLKKIRDQYLDNDNVEEYFKQLFDYSPIIMFVVNQSRKIVTMNKTGLDFLGMSLENVVSKMSGEVFDCIHNQFAPDGCGSGEKCEECKIFTPIVDTINTFKAHKQVEAELQIGDPVDPTVVSLLVSTVVLAKGAESRILVTIEDVSPLKKTAFELKQVLMKKKSLVVILLHDLSNLISLIDGRLGLLKTKDDMSCEERSQNLEEVNQTVSLIKDLLTQVSSIESIQDGKTSFNFRPTNLAELCEKLELIFKDRLRSKNITLDYSNVSDTKVMVEPTIILSSVLSNLVSNSIKFSDVGGKIVLETEENLDNVYFYCRDAGEGISKEKLDIIFSLKHRTTTVGTLGEKGTGYGLPVVKEMISLHGGDISINSHVEGNNKGTVVKLKMKKV